MDTVVTDANTNEPHDAPSVVVESWEFSSNEEPPVPTVDYSKAIQREITRIWPTAVSITMGTHTSEQSPILYIREATIARINYI